METIKRKKYAKFFDRLVEKFCKENSCEWSCEDYLQEVNVRINGKGQLLKVPAEKIGLIKYTIEGGIQGIKYKEYTIGVKPTKNSCEACNQERERDMLITIDGKTYGYECSKKLGVKSTFKFLILCSKDILKTNKEYIYKVE